MITPDTEYASDLIKAYVPEADQMPFDEALKLAQERDQAAAETLAESAETQLRMEQAAAAINAELDEFFQAADRQLFGGRVY